MLKKNSPSTTKIFVKHAARQTWSTALLVAFLLGGVALAVSSFSGPPAGCTPTSCPANPLKVIFSDTDPKVQIGTAVKPAKLEVSGTLQVGVQSENGACSGVGLISVNAGGSLLTCQSNVWKKVVSSGGSGSSYCKYKGKSQSAFAEHFPGGNYGGVRCTVSVNTQGAETLSLVPEGGNAQQSGACSRTASDTNALSCSWSQQICTQSDPSNGCTGYRTENITYVANFTPSTGVLVCSQSGYSNLSTQGSATLVGDETLCP